MTEDVSVDRNDELADWNVEDNLDILTRLTDWYRRFIGVTDQNDLSILALWTAHTHLIEQMLTTPRLRVDSTVWESGKTTVLDTYIGCASTHYRRPSCRHRR